MTDEEEDHALRLCFAIIRADLAKGELDRERMEQLLAVAEELLQENVSLKARLDVAWERP